MKIGKIKIEKPIALAPMEDVTDTPFRLICKRLDADLLYTEFVSSEALIRDVKSAFHKITIRDEERPIGIQIFGSRPLSMQNAAQVVQEARPDFIDINAGCWVRNLVTRGEGAGLLKDLKRFEEIVKTVVKAVKCPVTVKTRLGWDQENIVILEVAKMVEQAGAKALTLHCRTRTQGFKGIADWSWLSKIRKVIKIPLIGNGDILTPEDVKTVFETGCDGVMIGRGAVTNPWIFRQAKYFLKTGEYLPEASFKERIELCIEHLKLSVNFKGECHGVNDFRKHYAGYLRDHPGVVKLRSELVRIKPLQQILDRLQSLL
ncbi:MAG: tRNA dihydrouridine synthase DusB [Candidatus Omnitrophica bacterium]|nr:tRNA dihydrouridine synthase DusB [Candidatus Omnitrophota bacterium]